MTPFAEMAENIVARDVLCELDARAVLNNEHAAAQLWELSARIGKADKRILSSQEQIQLDNDMKAVLPAALFERYALSREGHVAEAVAHTEAGLLVGFAMGRRVKR